MENYADILFVDEVRALQDQDGTGEKYAAVYPGRTQDILDESTLGFIASRESFYIASVSSSGWPYVQHRGGPKGFLKALGPNRLGFADYRGNRQFITMGHTAHDNRVALFFMDYENRSRLKMLGHLTMQLAKEADPTLCEQLATPGQGRVDRIATLEVTAIDWNCPQYIPALIAADKAKAFVDEQLSALQEENARLKQELARLKAS